MAPGRTGKTAREDPVAGFDPEAVLRRLAVGELGPCGAGRFRIARDGTWFYEGSPIRRLELVRLFARVLHRAPDGRHWLITPFERIEVEVEETAFLAVALERRQGDDGPQLVFRTQLEDEVVLSDAHPLRLVRDGRGHIRPRLGLWRGLEARLTRPVWYRLAELAEEDGDGRFVVRSAGAAFALEPEPA